MRAMISIPRLLGGLLAAAAIVAPAWEAAAQPRRAPGPSAQLRAVFSKDLRATLCGPADTVALAPLLGELASRYGINVFALPPNPDLRGVPLAATTEARAAAWIVEAADGTAAALGLQARQHNQLRLMRSDLADYLWWASEERTDHEFRTRGDLLPERLPVDSGRADALLTSLLAPLLGIEPRDGVVTIGCRPAPPQVAAPAPNPPRRDDGGARSHVPSIAVRGAIDDLAARPTDADEMKKAGFATLSFSDNNEQESTTFAINGVIGLGTAVGRDNALFGFVQYTRNDQETDALGDEDDAKDVHAISPGLFLRRPLAPSGVRATLGLTAYATFDLQNDAELIRGRLSVSDISIDLGRGSGLLCGQERRVAFLVANCRISLFAEAANVLDAGTNADLLENADDEYIGVGGDATIILTPAFLPSLTLRGNYRAMAIVSGAMDNPERWDLSANYTLARAGATAVPLATLGLSYIVGENFETFQREDVWKLSVGLRF